jgi:LCP family protein required for cell wall assembly
VPTTTSRPSPIADGTVYTGRTIRPRRLGRILLIVLAILTTIGLFVGGYAFYTVNSVDNKLKRDDPFAGITGGRPPKTVDGALNILVLGSDSRDGAAYNPNDPSSAKGNVKGERSDSIMLVHIPADHTKAQIISIPRDMYVFVPEYKGEGGRKAKINAAYAWGGATLTTMTVERFTGVHIDHVAKIDFNGFKKMTDAVGGVTVYVNETTYDKRSKRTFKKGYNKLNGDQALDYVRQRYGLPRGDFDRVQRQQIFMRALLQKATDTGTLTNLPKLKKFLDATADAVTVDDGFQLSDMVLQFRKLRPSDLTFITTPNRGSDNIGGQSVVVSDKEKAAALFEAVNQDKVDAWLKANPPNNAAGGR